MQKRLTTKDAVMFGLKIGPTTGFIEKPQKPLYALGCALEFRPVQTEHGPFMPIVITATDPSYKLYVKTYGKPSSWPPLHPSYEGPSAPNGTMSMAAFMSPKKRKNY